MKRAILYKTDGTIKPLKHIPSISQARKLVSGYVEVVAAYDLCGVPATLYVDEDGHSTSKLVNKYITKEYGESIRGSHIVGDVVVIKEEVE